MSLTTDDIKKLSAPFPDDTVGVRIQGVNKDGTRARLVCYLQHTDVYTRIEAVDPSWKSEILSVDWVGTACFTRMRLTILGASRENVGEGEDPKSSASDAIKRCAMLFGVGRYLYDVETVTVDYNEARDKWKTWTVADFKSAQRRDQAPLPSAPAAQSPAPRASAPRGTAPTIRTKEQIGQEIDRVSGELGMTRQQLHQWVLEDYKKTPAQMTVAEMAEFLIKLQCELGRKGA